MNIIVDFIEGLPQRNYRHGFNKPEGIVAHSTGIMNMTNDTVARNRRVFTPSYVRKRGAFVHGFVDHESYWQSADYRYIAHGAGTTANRRFIHIELCETKNREHFLQSYKNFIGVIVDIMKTYGWKPERQQTLWTHGEVASILGGTTHNDPFPYFNYHDITINQFYKDVKTAYEGKTMSIDYPGVKWGSGLTEEQIVQLQRALITLGYDLSQYGDDGIYGKETANAVMIYERRHHESADGHADPAIFAAILADAENVTQRKQKPEEKIFARLVSGTFATEEDRNQTADKIAKETGWTIYKAGCMELRIATGTFTTEESVRKAENIMKKYVKVVYVKYE
ncbi:N-acetylmuramoyl-L-alanine amidase [Bacillus sp. B190/17]|uniref:Autolysin n=1 Tax=Bacillus lumedeiriae TaxID=3058829 RepID=A0ABW8I3Q7_9BACI